MTDEQIIAALDFEDGTDQVKRQMVEGVRETVEMRVITILTEMMSEDQQAEFQKLADAGDDGAVWAWLRTHVVGTDVSEVYEGALEDYIEEFKAQMAR